MHHCVVIPFVVSYNITIMQSNLHNLMTDWNNCVMLGLITAKGGANQAIDAICETDKSHKFTMDELRERLCDYPLLALGLELLIMTNFR